MIVEYYNLTHLLVMLIFPLVIYFTLYFALRKRKHEEQRRILIALCIFNIALYLTYKIVQYFVPYYDFHFFMNLPLHFCNINLFLLPLALLLRSKTLMAYQFYFGVGLSALALLSFDASFESLPIYEFTTFVYFYYHSFLLVAPILLVTLKFFRPSFEAVWKSTALIIALTACIHLVNILLRITNIASEANYFFTYGLPGSPLTEAFWAMVPYPFFFLIPSLLTFAPFILLTTIPYAIKDRKMKKKKSHA
jgi:uncharacterized membrane protein YwaF